jgi:hypothetical protein
MKLMQLTLNAKSTNTHAAYFGVGQKQQMLTDRLKKAKVNHHIS